MTNPRQLTQFVGFTQNEVELLCAQYGMSIEELSEWYDGYSFAREASVYTPKSVVEAVMSGVCDTYWNQTETFEALRVYIDMNFEGLGDDVLRMMSDERVRINTRSFSNDMVTFHTKDDVLTLLVHLGYLGYDFDNESVFIPNNEIRREFFNAVSVSDWGEVSRALVVELKWDKSANGAIAQIKEKQYCQSLEDFKGKILLVGVNYNKSTKKHECVIETDIKQ